MIEVFADESGKLNDSKFLCFCACIMDSDATQEFNNQWKVLLDRDNRAYIHMRELTSLGAIEVDRQLADYQQVIRENLLAIVSIGLDLVHYRKMERWKQELLGQRKPMQFCFSRLMRRVADKIQEWESQQGSPYPKGCAALIFDDDEEYTVKCYRLYANIRENREAKRLFSIFSAADDKYVPGLQAADVVAWYQNRDLRSRLVANAPLGTNDAATQPETFKSELYDAQGLERAVIEIIARGLSPRLWF